MAEREDSAEIRAHLARISAEGWLGRQRRGWPSTIYHFSDVRAVASILRTGRIYSRNEAEARGLHTVEIASLDVIEASPWTHDYARLYLRPLTPTQYHNEGIRPEEMRSLHSHCPVPVFLLFDAAGMLTRPDAEVTDGNFASQGCNVGSGVEFLQRLNYRTIYHNEPYPSTMSRGERIEITRARCAEVIFRSQVDLEHLREVVCRTPAERQTLLTLLGDHRAGWLHRVRTEQPGERLFHRDWAHVQEARYADDIVTLTTRFGSGSYEVRGHTRYPDGAQHPWTWAAFTGPKLESITIRLPVDSDRVFVELFIAGCLAYQGYLSRRSIF